MKKTRAADGVYRCYVHLETVTDDEQSPVRRRSDVAAASSEVTLQRHQVTEAIGKLRAGIEIMQNAIQKLDDAVAKQ